MGIFGRRGKHGRHGASGRGEAGPALEEDGYAEDQDYAEDEYYGGPFDADDAPDDGQPRLDLGSVRLPLPDGAQVQVEMDPAGPVRAVHVLTPVGQFTVGAYAAPRSGGLWQEVAAELAQQLNSDGARVRRIRGDWGNELSATINDVALRFIGVDGVRWMLRAVSAGPIDRADEAAAMLRDLVENTVVVRGNQPMPVRTPLAITLPPEIAAHVQAQQNGQG